MDDYVAINKANWNSRVEYHLQGYDLDKFRASAEFISDVVRFDQVRLGDIEGLDVVHLQCHIGTDTISLSRLGAKSVTGLDFSPAAIAAARALAVELKASIDYVESNVYDAIDALGSEQFDLVYTGVGALCWLPSVAKWAQTVEGLLRPGGRLFIREGHPMLWALSEPRPDGLITLDYPYFETDGTPFSDTHSYVEHEGELSSPETIGFNHGIGEILTAVSNAGLILTSFEEHDTIPWNAFDEGMVELEHGEFRLRESPERLAASYTLQASKPT
jgi:SAM-dependent methyltransferase